MPVCVLRVLKRTGNERTTENRFENVRRLKAGDEKSCVVCDL